MSREGRFVQFEAIPSAQARTLDHGYLQNGATAFGQFSQESFGPVTGRSRSRFFFSSPKLILRIERLR
jgi:hypothetical protein